MATASYTTPWDAIAASMARALKDAGRIALAMKPGDHLSVLAKLADDQEPRLGEVGAALFQPAAFDGPVSVTCWSAPLPALPPRNTRTGIFSA